MFLMYVDESGDSGLINSPSTHFVLSGLVIHESDWIAYFLFQNLSPNKYIKGGGAHNYFFRLKPVLCLEARPSDPYGIVRL